MTAIVPARHRPVAALALAGFLWGTADVAGKVALGGFPPITLAAVRFAVAFVVLRAVARWLGCRPAGGPRVALLGVLGVAAAFLLQNAGLERTGAANASMLQAGAPVVIVLGAALFLREGLGRARLAGTATSLVGVAALTVTGDGGPSHPGTGDLCILGSVVCFAAFVLLGRTLLTGQGTVTVLAGAVGWAMLLLTPLAAVELLLGGVVAVDPVHVLLAVYLGIGCSALTYLLWCYALRHLEAGQAAVFDNIIPIVGVAAAALLLGERPAPPQLAGGAFVLIGAWVASRSGEPGLVVAERA